MVVSKIDNSISYPEIKKVRHEDKEGSIELYAIQVRGVDIVIAIGRNDDETYKDKNVTYFPIYLITNKGKAIQIGVYEIKTSDIINVISEDGSVLIQKMPEPLPYTFATKEMLERKRLDVPDENPDSNSPQDKQEESEEVEDQPLKTEDFTINPSSVVSSSLNIPSYREDIFALDQSITPPDRLVQETAEDSRKEREAFHKSDKKSASWVQKSMQNMNYNFVDTENNGDCLFATIREAFSEQGQITTVSQLRKKLSLEVDQNILQEYLTHYKMSSETLVTESNNLKTLEKEYNSCKDAITNTISDNQQRDIINTAKSVAEQHSAALSRKTNAQEIYNEFKFMKKVKDLQGLQKVIQTPEYWADSWAIATLERILNVKFIVMSTEHASNESDNVIQCTVADEKMESRGIFEPEFYIIVEHTSNHYRLITYKNKRIFTFSEIPFDLKNLVLTKCVEKNSGAFFMIPEFKAMALNLDENTLKPDVEILNLDILTSIDPNVVFQFYHRSLNKAPGKGTGEKIHPPEKRIEYSSLTPKGKYKDWRRKLDNKWYHEETPFHLDNYKWNSVVHYLEANKWINNKDIYFDYTSESGSRVSKDVDSAIEASKKHKSSGNMPDPNFIGRKEDQLTFNAMNAKFTQIPEFKKLLMSTKNATLNKYEPGKPPSVDQNLIKIRNTLANNTT
tara:strand:- start:7273 stop:9306 length:2034 start_codon:yes stop_codon:yes gene_type:complete